MSLPTPRNMASLPTQRWAHGSTQVLLAGPDPDAWQWRLSLARIDEEGDFSACPETRRLLVPLDAPVALNQQHILRLRTIAFAGDPPPECALPEGATRAFNLMLRRGAEGELHARPIVGAMMLPARGQDAWFVFVVSGQLRVSRAGDSRELAADDYLLIPSTDERAILEGGGEIVTAKLIDA
jgi:environmental stress-induced protein Ves